MDPFGGIRGKDKRELSGFAIDKEEAIAELNQSIKLFEKRDVKKKSGFLDSLKNKNKMLQHPDLDIPYQRNKEL